MASPSPDLHFVFFPLMCPGHMIPMVDIARLLAQRGLTVTIITTPVNATRFKPVISRAIQDNLNIQLLQLHLRLSNVGLPEGSENLDMLPSTVFFPKMLAAAAMLEEPAEKLLRQLSPYQSCIISDIALPWTTDLARRLNIPRLVFHGSGCFTSMCVHMVMNTNVVDEIASDSEYFAVPGLFDRIEVTKEQALIWGRLDQKERKDFLQRVRETEEAADGIVVNSFEELEPNYVEDFAKVKGKKVWCIGPVSLCNKSFLDVAERGSKAAIDEHGCLKWLDWKKPRSVIFVCMGSMARPCTDQSIEVALGLESSNVPFIWCVRHMTDELEQWFQEKGYEERVKDRGLIVRGWAPQVLILSHLAIGGFLTHCGWNSSLEGICAGVPMITWPHFADQFVNERFLVNVLKIGVGIGVEVPVRVGEQDQVGVLVKKEDVKTALERLMDGEARRKRAQELGEMAKRAMEEGGSSYVNITSLIQDIKNLSVKE